MQGANLLTAASAVHRKTSETWMMIIENNRTSAEFSNTEVPRIKHVNLKCRNKGPLLFRRLKIMSSKKLNTKYAFENKWPAVRWRSKKELFRIFVSVQNFPVLLKGNLSPPSRNNIDFGWETLGCSPIILRPKISHRQDSVVIFVSSLAPEMYSLLFCYSIG